MHRERSTRFRRYQNAAYDPWATKVDERVPCTICGFPIDPERWQHPEKAVYEIVTTGTTYAPPTGTPVEDLGVADKRVETRYALYAGCPLCGSPNWDFAREIDLLR